MHAAGAQATQNASPTAANAIVLAYLSIGEAETYRYYWQWTWGGRWYTDWLGWSFAPTLAWLRATAEWRRQLRRALLGAGLASRHPWAERVSRSYPGGRIRRRLSRQGRFRASRRSPRAGRRARDDMRDFVGEIAERGRRARPGFLVVPQNGEELLIDPAYRRIIDGIGKEDLLYGEFKDKRPNPAVTIPERGALLKLLTRRESRCWPSSISMTPAHIAAARRRLTRAWLRAAFRRSLAR